MISVRNLTKKYKTGESELIALNNVSFDVEGGEFLALTGRSGAGKSTLLYQLGLLDYPSEGKIFIDKFEISSFDEKQRVIYRRDNYGFIFQDYALLPSLTAEENVIMPMLMQGLGVESAKKKSDEALTRVGLADKFNNLPSQLSGGQQQRVSIARSIAHGPKILFADEPTANLDTESSKLILDIFLKLNRDGQTIIMVTHEPEYAALADRNIQLLDGKMIKDKKLSKKRQSSSNSSDKK